MIQRKALIEEAWLQSDLDVEVARQRAGQAEMRLEDVRAAF